MGSWLQPKVLGVLLLPTPDLGYRVFCWFVFSFINVGQGKEPFKERGTLWTLPRASQGFFKHIPSPLPYPSPPTLAFPVPSSKPLHFLALLFLLLFSFSLLPASLFSTAPLRRAERTAPSVAQLAGFTLGSSAAPRGVKAGDCPYWGQSPCELESRESWGWDSATSSGERLAGIIAGPTRRSCLVPSPNE